MDSVLLILFLRSRVTARIDAAVIDSIPRDASLELRRFYCVGSKRLGQATVLMSVVINILSGSSRLPGSQSKLSFAVRPALP